MEKASTLHATVVHIYCSTVYTKKEDPSIKNGEFSQHNRFSGYYLAMCVIQPVGVMVSLEFS